MKTTVITEKQLTLYEYVHPEHIQAIMNHPHIHEPQRIMYEKMHTKWLNSSDGAIQTDYVRDNYGRFKIKNSSTMSFTPMWNRARTTLCEDDNINPNPMQDIDMVNAQPNLLLHELIEMKANDENPPPPFEHVKLYCDERDRVINECHVNDAWLQKYNAENHDNLVKKDLIKNLFIVCMFGGTEKSWSETWNLSPKCPENYTLCSDMQKCIGELPAIFNYLYKSDKFEDLIHHEKNEYKLKCKNRNKEVNNAAMKRHCVAVLLQDLECKLCVEAMKIFHDGGISVSAYCYDGFMILKQNTTLLQTLLTKINKLHPRIGFIVKPFRSGLDMSNVRPRGITFDINVLNDYYRNAKSEDEKKVCYQNQKAYFELSHCWVYQNLGMLQMRTEGHYTGVTHFKYNEFKEAHENLLTWQYSQKYKEWSSELFVEKWKRDMSRLSYQAAELYPPGGFDCPTNCKNTWVNFKILQTPYDKDAKFDLVLHHIKTLIPDKSSHTYFINWLALKVQKPGMKIGTVPVLYGRQGTGKSCLSEDIWEAFLGNAHYYCTADVQHLLGRFADNSNYVLIVLNEASGKDNKKDADKLKSAITATKAAHEIKGGAIIKNKNQCWDSILTTNNFNVVDLDNDDRRFVIINCNDDLAKRSNETLDYFDKLKKQLTNLSSMRALFQYLQQYDISSFDPRKIPMSMLKSRMVMSQEKPHVTWFKTLLPELTPEQRKHSGYNYLYQSYEKFIEESGFQHKENKTFIKVYLEGITGVRFLKKQSGPDARGIKIDDFDKACEHLKIEKEEEYMFK